MPISDCVSIILQCEKCDTIALRPLPEHEGLYFPTHFYGEESDSAASAVKHLLASLQSGEDWYTEMIATSDLLQQTDKTGKSYSRLLYQAKLQVGTCCSEIKGLKWIRIENMSSFLNDCCGAEPAIIASLLLRKDKGDLFPKLIENRISTNIQEFQKGDQKQQLVTSAGFGKENLISLFQEFYHHSFPSMFWTLNNFRSYAKKIHLTFNKKEGYTDHEIRRLYKSFLPYGQMYLTFKDFVLGIVCMQKKTPHGAAAGFFRMERIFRFYDVDRKSKLAYPAMMQMRKDILRIKRLPSDPESLKESVRNDYSVLGIQLDSKHKTPHPAHIVLPQLLDVATQLSDKGMRGFSTLYRLDFDINDKKIYAVSKQSSKSSLCASHRPMTHSLAAHTVVINEKGFLKGDKVQELDTSMRTSGMHERLISKEFTSKSNLSQEILNLVHELAELIRKKVGFTKETCSEYENSSDWSEVEDNVSSKRIELVRQILVKGRQLFQKQSRIPKVASPCIVFGDIHGNLSDLMTFERLFWARFPFETPTLVFLGDFVDRGKQSVEVFLYLVAMKCLVPDRVLILRGNHETRAMHEKYGFKDECADKFGDIGMQVWQGFNEVMDCIPVAGLIDEQLFCCHGGIPFTESKITNLMKMPGMLAIPEEEYPAAMEIMWSDPSEKNEMADMRMTIGSADTSLESDMGTFYYNFKRSTGHYFDEEALKRFNILNGTSHLLRGHELKALGYAINFDGLAITVFSSSSYQRNSNIAAVLLILDGLIIPSQIDT